MVMVVFGEVFGNHIPWGGAMGLSSTDWTALGSIFTAIAAIIALLVGILPYRQQNRLARATALRGLVRTVLHDSQEIYDLTAYASSVIPDAQVRAFRAQLGLTATADDFRKFFFTDRSVLVATSFIGASLDSPAYTRLNELWNDIDRTSAELPGRLRILYDAAALIVSDSQQICFPDASVGIAYEMAGDGEFMARCQDINNIDILVITLSQELVKRTHSGSFQKAEACLDHGRSFVDSLAGTVQDLRDARLRDLSSDRTSDWSDLLAYGDASWPLRRARGEEVPEDDHYAQRLDNVGRLMHEVQAKISAPAASDLEKQFIEWQEAYAK